MKSYYYLLYRIYNYYLEKGKEEIWVSISRTLLVSTLLIYFFLYTSCAYVDFYSVKFLDKIVTGKTSVIILMAIIGLLNYWFFIKPKKFLNYGFKADKKGGYAIIGLIVLMAVSFVFIANKNRDRIFKEREKARIENKL
jgi:amino acid transporter